MTWLVATVLTGVVSAAIWGVLALAAVAIALIISSFFTVDLRLEPRIMTVLKGEMTGLQIMDALEQRYGQRYSLGSLYPVLHRMRDEGLLNHRRETDEEVQQRIEKDGKDIRLGYHRYFYSKTGLGSKKRYEFGGGAKQTKLEVVS